MILRFCILLTFLLSSVCVQAQDTVFVRYNLHRVNFEAERGNYMILQLNQSNIVHESAILDTIPKHHIIGLIIENYPGGELEMDLKSFSNLQGLEIGYYLDEECPMKEIPDQVFEIRHLENLSMYGIPLGKVPAEIQQMSNLRYLKFVDCGLTAFPGKILSLSRLTHLDLGGNSFSIVPPDISKLANLQYLRFAGTDGQHTPINGLPSSISKLRNLRTLSIGNRQRAINLPDEICQLKRLEKLYIDCPDLTELPKKIGKLSKLQRFEVYADQLVALPESFFDLKNLQFLKFRTRDAKAGVLLQEEQLRDFAKKRRIATVQIEVLCEGFRIEQ